VNATVMLGLFICLSFTIVVSGYSSYISSSCCFHCIGDDHNNSNDNVTVIVVFEASTTCLILILCIVHYFRINTYSSRILVTIL